MEMWVVLPLDVALMDFFQFEIQNGGRVDFLFGAHLGWLGRCDCGTFAQNQIPELFVRFLFITIGDEDFKAVAVPRSLAFRDGILQTDLDFVFGFCAASS